MYHFIIVDTCVTLDSLLKNAPNYRVYYRHNNILIPMNNLPLVGCACAGRANLEQHQCTIRPRILGSAMHGIAT